MRWVMMRERELGRIEVLSRVVDGSMSTATAKSVLAVSTRHIRRMVKLFREFGAAALRHGLRGRPSNNQIRIGLHEDFTDFGPMLAAEKLLNRHELKVSGEPLRGWMAEVGLSLSRRQRRTFHQLRMHFVPSASTFAYFAALDGYLEQHDRPAAFYSDKHSIFRVAKAKAGQGMTQFGRPLSKVGLSVPTAPCRTGWSRNCGCKVSATWLAEFVPARVHGAVQRAVRQGPGQARQSAQEVEYRHGPQGRDPVLAGSALCLKAADPSLRTQAHGVWSASKSRPMPLRTVASIAAGKATPCPTAPSTTTNSTSPMAITENKRLSEMLASAKALLDASPPKAKTVGKQKSRHEPTGKKSPGRRSWLDKRAKRRAEEAAQGTGQVCDV